MSKRKGGRLTPEQAKALLEQRRLRDPITYYNETPTEDFKDAETGEVYRLGPGPTQLRCMLSTASYRLLLAGNQKGKTTHCIWECAQFARGKHPARPWYGPVNILVVVPSRSQSISIWHHRLCVASQIKGPAFDHPLIPKHEIEHVFWNYSGSGKAPGRIVLKNGSQIWFAWAGAEGQWERVQGNMYDAIFRDEAVGNMKLGTELLMRLVAVQSDQRRPHGGFILWSATPTLINREFHEYRRRCEQRVVGHELFFIDWDENPALSVEVQERMRLAMSEHDQKVRLEGSGSQEDQYLIYAPLWEDSRHLAQKNYEPGVFDTLWISFDPSFGSTASEVGILFAAQNRDEPNTIRVVGFEHYKNGTLQDHVQCMRNWLRGRFIEALVVDPAIMRTESTGRSVYSQLEELIESPEYEIRSQRGIVLGRNRRDDGIPLVQSYLRQRLILLNPDDEGCQWVRWSFLDYRTREESKYSGPKGIVDHLTESMDCIRYLVTTEPCWVDRGPNVPRWERNPLQVVAPEDLEGPELEGMSEEERIHRERLKLSAALVDELRGPMRAALLPQRRIG